MRILGIRYFFIIGTIGQTKNPKGTQTGVDFGPLTKSFLMAKQDARTTALLVFGTMKDYTALMACANIFQQPFPNRFNDDPASF
jgi:hypothetical protein